MLLGGGGDGGWRDVDVGSSTATRLSVDQKETGFGILSESSFIRKNIGSKQFWRANF